MSAQQVMEDTQSVLAERLHQATALHAIGLLYDAESMFEAILRDEPCQADALHGLGIIALRTYRAQRAVELIGLAIALGRDGPAVHSDIADGLLALGRIDEAIAHCDRALEFDATRADLLVRRGNARFELSRFGPALEDYERALALRPELANAHYGRGNVLRLQLRHEEALASYDAAIALWPDFALAHNNRGNALHHLGLLDAALASYEAAIAVSPGYAEAHGNRASTLDHLGRKAEALAAHDRAIALQPALASARWNKGHCLLRHGDFEQGWALAEWRLRLPTALEPRGPAEKLWLGQAELAGALLYLHWEQGLGDTIQFCRYVPMAQALGARIVLSVQEPLRGLLAESLPGVMVIGSEQAPAEFDFYCPLPSLPLAFRTHLARVPAPPRYLHSNDALRARWAARTAALPGLRVGLVWAGGYRADPELATVDSRRSLTLAEFAPLAGVRGVSFVSLQKGPPAAQALAPPAGMELHDWTGDIEDFADTAALADTLDLVISVDTSVAHLAGALGRPVWLLNRFDGCWRWLAGRADSPWYPSMRIFNQRQFGVWQDVVIEVAEALAPWNRSR